MHALYVHVHVHVVPPLYFAFVVAAAAVFGVAVSVCCDHIPRQLLINLRACRRFVQSLMLVLILLPPLSPLSC